MESTRWEQAQSLFHQALELPQPERQAYLDSACIGDAALAAEVLAMLNADSHGSSLLDDGLSAIAQEFIASPGHTIPVREIGPYKLIGILGEGGMGVVWRAQREDTGAIVAIKLLLGAGFSPVRRERFTREIKTLAKLKHPYIARLYDAGALADGTPWFVMECVEGERLGDFCSKGRLSVDERLRLFRKVCEAVQYAHGQEIIHRDLKPSNILVEADGTPRLLDFGIAKELQGADDDLSERTRPGLRFHSPYYAAPEWLRDGTVGFYTDVYSLGIILYELLAGKLPIDRSRSAEEDDLSFAKVPPVKPSLAARDNETLGKNARKQAWPDLDLLCLKAMRCDATERYQSVEALLRDLDHYLKSEPLEARPYSVRYRLGKFVARNRRAVLATSLAFALVVGSIVFFTVWIKARNEARAELARKQQIQDFMLSLFGGSEKSAAPPSDLRAVELLDRGLEKANSLDSDPETQADLYQTLGRMYNMLGNSKKSSELLDLALDRAKRARGPNDISVADLLVQRGIVLADQGQYKEAEQSVREGLALASRQLPPNDPEVYYARAGLGRILCDSGSYTEATEVLEPILDWKPASDFQAQTLSESLAALGVARYSMGQYEAAEAINRRALALDLRIFGQVHPRTAADLANIALNKAARSHYSEAEPYYTQAIAIMTKWYGPDNPETAILNAAFAKTLVYEGKYEEAYPILQKALAIEDKAYEGRDFQIASALDALGRIEVKRGNLARAEAYFSRGFEMDKSLFGDDNARTANLRAGLGDVYVGEGHAERGELLLHNAVAVLQVKLPPGDKNLARARAMWGNSLVTLHRYSEAEAPLVSAYQIDHSLAQPPLDEVATLRRNLATVYAELQAPEKAREFEAQLASSAAKPSAHAP